MRYVAVELDTLVQQRRIMPYAQLQFQGWTRAHFSMHGYRKEPFRLKPTAFHSGHSSIIREHGIVFFVDLHILFRDQAF
jgi:hypothetical protein